MRSEVVSDSEGFYFCKLWPVILIKTG